MKIRFGALSFFGILVLSGCLAKRNQAEKTWFYVTGSNLSREYSNITPAGFINLEKDKTYTSNFNKFDYGQWEIKDKRLFLTSKTGSSVTYEIRYPSANEMQLKTPDESILDFEGKPLASSPETNPFSLRNNQWRIPAKAKESEMQIRERLYNHFLFQEQYFRWAMEKKLNSIDVRSTPSLIKIYGNGFELKKVNDLPDAWTSLFFDEENYKAATAIVKEIFDRSDIIWPQTDNKFKMFASAFQQLQTLVMKKNK